MNAKCELPILFFSGALEENHPKQLELHKIHHFHMGESQLADTCPCDQRALALNPLPHCVAACLDIVLSGTSICLPTQAANAWVPLTLISNNYLTNTKNMKQMLCIAFVVASCFNYIIAVG